LKAGTRTECPASRNSRSLAAVHRTVTISLATLQATCSYGTHLHVTSFTGKTAVSRLLVWLACLDSLHSGVTTGQSCCFLDLAVIMEVIKLVQTSVPKDERRAGASPASLLVSEHRSSTDMSYFSPSRLYLQQTLYHLTKQIRASNIVSVRISRVLVLFGTRFESRGLCNVIAGNFYKQPYVENLNQRLRHVH